MLFTALAYLGRVEARQHAQRDRDVDGNIDNNIAHVHVNPGAVDRDVVDSPAWKQWPFLAGLILMTVSSISLILLSVFSVSQYETAHWVLTFAIAFFVTFLAFAIVNGVGSDIYCQRRELDVCRITLKHPLTAVETSHFFSPEQEKANAALFRDAASGLDMETVDRIPMLEWLANNYKTFGATLEFVSNKSQEGSQFVKGFGGIGGQAITSAYVCIIESNLVGGYAVYFGGRLAYVIDRPNDKFAEDVERHRMVDANLGKSTYERTT
jgi:hypothetical protein